jgi:chromosome segregation ATPase
MSATITTLPSRSGESGEVAELHDRKAGAVQGFEAGLGARESFIAETAVKIDQLQATVRLLTRDVGELVGKVEALQEACALEDRWYAFHQSENRSKESKLDEMVRSFRDLKARLDRIEARSGGDYHAYNSFEAVSRKFAEIERSTSDYNGKNALRGWLLYGIMIGLGIVAGIMLAGSS